MNYLGRPVFLLQIDWSNPVNKPFTYDLSEVSLGFGAEVFTSLQLWTVRGYSLSLKLLDETSIKAFDDFTSSLLGRLTGFWLPVPFPTAEITAAVSATQFDVAGLGLTATWEDNPDQYLCFTAIDGTVQAAKITAVADRGAGIERVTIDTALNPAPVPGVTVQRLHYVRLADDTESGSFAAEGIQVRSLNVVELPGEYALAETGERPIYLYHLWCDAPTLLHWYFTSFAADVVSNGIRHYARPITHGALKSSIQASRALEITAAYRDDSPFLLFLPVPLARPMNVQVSQIAFSDPDATTPIFTGQVRVVEDQGESLLARCDAFANVIKRKLPRMLIQEQCPYWLYDGATCRVERNRLETSGIIQAIHADSLPPTVDLTLAFPGSAHAAQWQSADWFAHGFIEAGLGADFQAIGVTASSYAGGVLTLTLTSPLNAEAGAWVQLVPGCDRTADTCRTKFNNFVNFGGFVNIPLRNPSLKAVNTNVSSGGKK